MDNRLEIILAAKNHTEKAFTQVQQRVGALTKSVFSLNGAIVTFAGGAGLGMIAKGFLGTAMSFEKYGVMLETITGSSLKAKQSMDWIAEFTKKTPYELAQVTEGFVKLEAFGLSGTRWMGTLGDTASSMGKDLNQAVEMFADAVTGEFERLKEFGVKASTEGDKVTFKWSQNGKDMVMSADKTQSGISDALEQIFSRFKGGMEKQSKTLEGMLSNISDQWVMLQKTMMDAGIFEEIKIQVGYVGKEFANWVEANEDLIKQNIPVYIDNTKEAVKNAYDGLMHLKGLYDSIPDDIKGAAGYGIIGSMLLGKKGGALVGSLAFLTGELTDFAEGVSGLMDGTITADEFFGDEREFEAALARKRKLAEEFVKDINVEPKTHSNLYLLDQIKESSKPKVKPHPGKTDHAFSDEIKAYAELKDFQHKTMTDMWQLRINGSHDVTQQEIEESDAYKERVAENLASMSESFGQFSTMADKPVWVEFEQGWSMALENIKTQVMTTAEMVSSGIGTAVDGIGNAMGQWVSGAKSFKDAFSDMARSVVQDLISMITKQLLYNAISSIAGMGSNTGAASGAGGAAAAAAGGGVNAHGNAFDGGGMMGFAQGGTFTNSIVRKPTFFRYAQGDSFGVMGEAGPEAILPLSRTKTGDLGVKVSDSSSASAAPPQVNIKNINVLDPALVGEYLNTDDGEQQIINLMQKNKSILE